MEKCRKKQKPKKYLLWFHEVLVIPVQYETSWIEWSHLNRWTSLSLVVRLKDYENGHKKIYVFSKTICYWRSNIAQFWFAKYSMSKISRIFTFFSSKNTKMGDSLLLLTYFDNFDFKSLKMHPNFDVWYQIKRKPWSIFMDVWPCLFTPKLSYSQLFKVRNIW